MPGVFIGISGWNYDGWRGAFYPDGLPRKHELAFAARLFNTIEINGTFYSLQRPDSFRRWHHATPERFRFAVKGSRFMHPSMPWSWPTGSISTGDTTMQNDRIASLRRMLEKNPDDSRVRFGLAAEYEKAGNWEAAAEELQRYLASTDDEGNAWGRLGHALRELGRTDEARAAYQRGIDAATRHGHPTMALEFEEILADW